MKKFKLIYHSFSKPKKYFYFLTILVGFTLSFMAFIKSYSQISYQMRCSDLLYGDYTSCVTGYSEDYDLFFEKLSKDKQTEYIYPFSCIESRSENDDTDITIYGVDENFWNHTEYELIEGNYPSSASEIVCERAYLYHLGYTREQMIGARITIMGKSYSVCGIYTRNLLYSDNSNKHIMLTMYNGNPNSFIFKVSDSFFEDPLLENGSYTINLQTNFNNYIKLEERGKIKIVSSVIFFVLLICSAFIINHIIVLVLRKHRQTISVYELIGISRFNIWKALIARTAVSIFLGMLSGIILYCISFGAIIIIYNSICGLSIAEITGMIIFSSVIKDFLIYSSFLMIIILIRSVMIIISRKSAGDSVGISRNSRIRKMVPRVTSAVIARRHIKLSFFANITTILVISLIIAAFSSTELFLSESKVTFDMYKDYDYMITPEKDFFYYIYDNVSYEDFIEIEDPFDLTDQEINAALDDSLERYTEYWDKINKKYIEIQKSEINDLVSMCDESDVKNVYSYLVSADIPVNYLSESLQDYFRDYTDAYYSIIMGKEKIPVDVNLIVLSDEDIKNINLADNNSSPVLSKGECIAFGNYTSASNDSYQINFRKGDNIELQCGRLNIKYVSDIYKNSFISDENCIILGVSYETYNFMTGRDIPDMLLFKVNSSIKEKFENNLILSDFLNIVDLNESIQHEKIEECQNILYYTATIFLLVFSVLSCIFSIYMRCIIFDKEYATMNAIGIPANFTRGVIFRELLYSIIPVVIISLLLIVPVYNYIAELNYGDSVTKFPLLLWSGSCVCVVAIGVICAVLLIKKFDSYVVMQNKE